MLRTISTTQQTATDMGELVHKHSDRCQAFDFAFGKAHAFWSQAAEERYTVALLVAVDPIGLVRDRRGPAGKGSLGRRYVSGNGTHLLKLGPLGIRSGVDESCGTSDGSCYTDPPKMQP